MHKPWGAFLLHLNAHLISYTCFVVYIFMGEWGYHACAPCIAMEIIWCAQTLGSFPILYRASIRSYHNIFSFIWYLFLVKWLLDLFDCLLHLLMPLHRLFHLQSLDPQYSLISSQWSSLDILCGGILTILAF